MKKQKILLSSLVFVLGFFSVVVLSTQSAFAATKTWDGSADSNFNTAANWSGDSVPQNGDDLVFSLNGMSEDSVINNNMSNLSVASITFSGSNPSHYRYTITGNELTITDAIDDAADNYLALNIKLGGDVTATYGSGSAGSRFGQNDSDTTFNTNGNDLTITGEGGMCGVGFYSALAGSGDIKVDLPDGGVNFYSAASNFTGAVIGTGGLVGVSHPSAFGSTSGVTISGSTQLGLALNGANRTYDFPITIGGSGVNGVSLYATNGSSIAACSGGANDTKYTGTLTADMTLTSNIVFNAYNANVKLTGDLLGDGNVTVKAGASGTFTANGETIGAKKETITIGKNDKQPDTFVNIGYNQTYIINGIRGGVVVNDGGVLKGKGTVGDLRVNDGGTVAPGESPGCLSAGNTYLAGGSIFSVEIGGRTKCTGYDQLVVSGTVTIENTATLNVNTYGDFTPSVGDKFTILNNNGSDAISGKFADLAEGASFTQDGVQYRITYKGGTGNDIVLTVLNVPGAPDAGFARFTNNPLFILGITSICSAGVVLLARRLNKGANIHA